MGLEQIEMESQTRHRLFKPGEQDASFSKVCKGGAPRRARPRSTDKCCSRSAFVLSSLLVVPELVKAIEQHFAQCTIMHTRLKAATCIGGTQAFGSCHPFRRVHNNKVIAALR